MLEKSKLIFMKKILCLIIVSVMSVMVLFLTVSCGNDDKGDNIAPTDSPDSNSNTDAGMNEKEEDVQEPDASEFAPVEEDMDGYKFKILGFASETGSWIAGMYSDVMAEGDTGDPINDAIYKRNRAVEELYNIEISLIEWPQSDSPNMASRLIKSIRAGDDDYDAALLSGSSLPNVFSIKNSLYDINEITSLDLSKSYWDQKSRKDLSINNKQFVVVGDISLYSFFANTVMYFNKKILGEYELEDPYDLVRQNKWTWDKLHSMARDVTKDLNGDGVIDQEDQIGFISEGSHLGTIYLTTGESITKKDESDIPMLALGTERSLKAYDYAFDLLSDANTTFRVENAKGKFTNPFHEWATPKFYQNEVLFFYNQLLVTFELRNMDTDFGILPPPKFDESQDRYFTTSANWFLTHVAIPTTNQNPERSGKILDAMCYYSQQYVKPAFYDVSITSKLTRDEDTLEMLNIIRENRTFEMAYIFNWNNMTHDLFYQIITSKRNTFVSAYDKIQDKIKSSIEKTINEILD
ncbi:MAG: extracellular solute-binding protein [Oscillospiraceae bacterium]|nr:extracellular solute-binding protein [Oscillospiraceae bacterium]